MSVLDQVWHPGAARAREDQETRHERSVPSPSPGDRLLRTGRVRIGRRDGADDEGAGDGAGRDGADDGADDGTGGTGQDGWPTDPAR